MPPAESILLVYVSIVSGLTPRRRMTNRAHPWERLILLPPTISYLYFLSRKRTPWDFYATTVACQLILSLFGLVYVAISRKTVSQQTSWYFGFCSLPEPAEVQAGRPTTCWFLHCVQLCFSVMVSVCCEERLPWWGAAVRIRRVLL